MQYTSTRNSFLSVDASQAIAAGLSEEGGLFVPDHIPAVDDAFIRDMEKLSYPMRAFSVLRLFLTDYPEQQLREVCAGAYTAEAFENNCPAPLSSLSDSRYLLELWHGPTCAFKDMALQLMPRLLVPAVARTQPNQNVLILVATSGDTGKAALEGFADVDGVSTAVFYPDKGVSEMQRLQMATQTGKNVEVFAVEGNFDNAQAQVKSIFTDPMVVKRLKANNIILSSANSINWGRLVPQIVYYFSAYADLQKNKCIKPMQKINVVVPTGNFGNILAAYYAMRMGLPIDKLICASNRNNILSDFFNSGVYDANRAFHTTLSPSMDILISSNLERLLYEINNRDAKEIAALMTELASQKRYAVSKTMHQSLKESFWAGWVTDAECKGIIENTFEKYGYIADPHTAVAIGVHRQYTIKTGDVKPTVIVSTASPFKFATSVLDALNQKTTVESRDGFKQLEHLSAVTGIPCPKALSTLQSKPLRFNRILKPSEMADAVVRMAENRKEF